MKKAVLIIALLGLCPLAAACVSTQTVVRTSQSGPFSCPRQPAVFDQLARELNYVRPPCQARLECWRGQWGNQEVKEVAGYALDNWLWVGTPTGPFTVAEQDVFIAEAEARAQTARPAGKTLRTIVFFTTFITGNPNVFWPSGNLGDYRLGAYAYYGNCVGSSLPQPEN